MAAAISALHFLPPHYGFVISFYSYYYDIVAFSHYNATSLCQSRTFLYFFFFFLQPVCFLQKLNPHWLLCCGDCANATQNPTQSEQDYNACFFLFIPFIYVPPTTVSLWL